MCYHNILLVLTRNDSSPRELKKKKKKSIAMKTQECLLPKDVSIKLLLLLSHFSRVRLSATP